MNRWISWLATALLVLGLGSAGAPAADVAAPTAETYYLLIFNQPVPGREEEYNHWYDRDHVPDVVSVPGMVSAQRFVLAPMQLQMAPPKPMYAVIYQIKTSDLPAVYAEVKRRLKSGETKLSPALDMNSGENYTYRVLRPRLQGSQPDALPGDLATMVGYMQMEFTEPAADKEAEFSAWYQAHHAAEILKVQGFTSAQRLVLADVQLEPHAVAPPKYLAMFDIQSKDLGRTMASYGRTAPSASNPAFAADQVTGYTYRMLGPPLSGDLVRASRAAVTH